MKIKEYEIYKVTLLAETIKYPFRAKPSYKTVQHIGKYEGATPQAAVNAMAKDKSYTGHNDDEYFFAKPSRYINVNKRIQRPNEERFASCGNRKIYQPKKQR